MTDRAKASIDRVKRLSAELFEALGEVADHRARMHSRAARVGADLATAIDALPVVGQRPCFEHPNLIRELCGDIVIDDENRLADAEGACACLHLVHALLRG